jgi:site-specific DNA recombinase
MSNDQRWDRLPGTKKRPGYFSYARVSTLRQQEKQLSIPDQLVQNQTYVSALGGEIIGEYCEARTATDDRRPRFQAMIERACSGDSDVKGIIVHSFSRFMRDAHTFETYSRQLAEHGVRIISVTQPTGDEDNPVAHLARSIMNLFDEYQSKETGKHVIRSMKENARQGFWNGAPVPLGYELVEVEKRGNRSKCVLAIDEVDAEEVRLIFRMYLYGADGVAPMGVKALVIWLNANGHRTSTGALWGTGSLYKVLTNETYVGRAWFNRRSSKTGALKPISEHVAVECPAIISHDTFSAVQRTLAARNPRVTAPRETTGPILLTGLTVHKPCGGAMTLRTGTSRSGDIYRYYACSTCGRKGKMACEGLSVPMSKLDEIVIDHLCRRLLEPSHLSRLLSSVATRRQAEAESVSLRVQKLQSQVSGAAEKLKRLYRLVEDGVTEADDVLRERLVELRADRDRAQGALDRAKTDAAPFIQIDPALVEKFGVAMQDNLTSGSVEFRKAYLRAVVTRIEVDRDLIRIIGHKDRLESLVRSGPGEVAHTGSQMSTEWCAQGESNPCFRRERATS